MNTCKDCINFEKCSLKDEIVEGTVPCKDLFLDRNEMKKVVDTISCPKCNCTQYSEQSSSNNSDYRVEVVMECLRCESTFVVVYEPTETFLSQS